ncbi:hypothetical protein A6R68_16431 [Neotoma lepida]|uniref:Dipeptidase n=1 Tax=Neotoma lepida TaxID=56216 RepID=A0A1A6HEW8_NEOLE|nr:hypothetical protein A6R68_16431 [Neotoma lepida]
MLIIWWLWPLLAICASDSFQDRAKEIMKTTPVIDGHNDLPWQLLKLFNNKLNDSKANLNTLTATHTNIPKLRDGFVGGITQAFSEGKIASLIGVEGGHLIDSSLGVLRALYHLGMRYLTLTHNCNTPWSDNWMVDKGDDKAESHGLSDFGKRVLKEMNRLGVMIDLSHVAVATMRDALQLSKAPVIFSHSSAYSLCHHRRNVPDDILQLVKNTSSLVMVNFYSMFVSCSKDANLSQVADHLDYIKKVAGAEAVGLGGDYDGVTELPKGLEDVSKYPDLIAELLRRNWTDTEVRGVLSDNLLRVFSEVERVSNIMQVPEEEPIPLDKLGGSCRTYYGYSRASSIHLQIGALLASLAPLLLSLHPL